MDLEIFWFCLIVVVWAMYFLLEGFDFGVGMLLPFAIALAAIAVPVLVVLKLRRARPSGI